MALRLNSASVRCSPPRTRTPVKWFDWEVAEDVCVGNSVVIFSGTTASAVVTKTNSKKVKGAARQLALSVDSLNLADGTKALLRGTNESQGECAVQTNHREKRYPLTRQNQDI